MPDRDTVLAALGLPADSRIDWEPEGDSPGSPVHLVIPGEPPRQLVVREPSDNDAAQNHAAVFEALATAGYPHIPQLVGFAGSATIESEPPGVSAMNLVPPPGSAEVAIEALAALHRLPLREGLDWGRAPAELLPPAEVPLHRLGFSAAEREPALGPLRDAREVLLASPFGFAHRDAVAANITLAPGRAWLTNFATAGFGPHYFDVAAFLLTSGIEAPGRRALAAAYGQHAGISAAEATAAIDLLGILWGVSWLLELPRRLILSLGDDAATSSYRLAANRIERAVRQPAGDHPTARAIRAALWP